MKQNVFLLLCCIIGTFSCSKSSNKEYFVRPCEFVCDYPFNDTSKYAITCRVWGLLKHYHPNVTAGKVDWDKVLVDHLYHIKTATTPELVNVELSEMFNEAGDFKYDKNADWNDSLNMNLNLCWIDNSFLAAELRAKLKQIASLTVKQPSFYSFSQADYKTPLECKNEKVYSHDDIIYSEYRLLTLFRYWNIVYYFFPYKYKMSQSWDITLNQAILPFIEADNQKLFDVALQKLFARINDGHGFSSLGSAVMFRTAGHATLIGRHTAGANGNICTITLFKNLVTHFSMFGTYYPDRSETQRVGIIPDIKVYPTMESIKAGKDEILEAAIEYANTL